MSDGIKSIVCVVVVFLGFYLLSLFDPKKEKTEEHKRFELVEGLVTMADGKTLTDKEKANLWDLARDFVVNGDPLENATQ